MAHPTAVIAEDEGVLRDELRSHLAALWPELQIVGEYRAREPRVDLEALRSASKYREMSATTQSLGLDGVLFSAWRTM